MEVVVPVDTARQRARRGPDENVELADHAGRRMAGDVAVEVVDADVEHTQVEQLALAGLQVTRAGPEDLQVVHLGVHVRDVELHPPRRRHDVRRVEAHRTQLDVDHRHL